jgi:hypothetical protein
VTKMDWLPDFVEKHLSFTGKCFRHCDRPTSMMIISKNPTQVVGAYICPDAFVSQLVYFSTKPEMEWFHKFVSSQVGDQGFDSRDIRVASRHGWELGKNAQSTLETHLGKGASVKELYWTRYAKTEEQKKLAISLCVGDSSHKGCLRLFLHDRNSVQPLCPDCRVKFSK